MTQRTRAQEQKRRILEAALAVFADKGWSGARVDEIARRAGVNKAMLYYYVGNKNALYGQVLAFFAEKVVKELQEALTGVEPGPASLRVMQQTLARIFQRQPHLPRFLLRTLLEGPRHLPDVAFLGLMKVLSLTRQVLNDGVAHGKFRAVNPLLTHLLVAGSLVLGMVALSFARETNLQALFPGEEQVPSMEEAATLVSDILLQGLCLHSGGEG